jgi:chromosome segregation ATPase
MAISGIASSAPQAGLSLRPALKELHQEVKAGNQNFRHLQKDLKAGDWTEVDSGLKDVADSRQEVIHDRGILQELRKDLREYQRDVRQLYRHIKAGDMEAAETARHEVEATVKKFQDDMSMILPSPSEPTAGTHTGVDVVA